MSWWKIPPIHRRSRTRGRRGDQEQRHPDTDDESTPVPRPSSGEPGPSHQTRVSETPPSTSTQVLETASQVPGSSTQQTHAGTAASYAPHRDQPDRPRPECWPFVSRIPGAPLIPDLDMRTVFRPTPGVRYYP